MLGLQLDCTIFGLQGFGGISRYWASLITAIIDGHETRVSLVLPKNIQFRELNAEWLCLNAVYRERVPARLAQLLPCPRSDGNDIYHTPYYRLPMAGPYRIVATVHDFIRERYSVGPAKWIHTQQKRRCLERADAIACVSSFTRDEVLRFVPAVDPARLHVIPLGVDSSTFYQDVHPHDSGLHDTVLFVGRRGGYKRFDLAVNAIKQLPERFRLGIVGSHLTNRERVELEENVPGRWMIFGHISSSRLRQIYSSVYALIFPSDCEGFGLPMLEAMACGCPVVAAHRASLPEIGGSAALYALEQRSDCYADVLERLVDSDLRRRLSVDGLRRAAEFSCDETYRRTMAMYAKTL